MSSRAEPSWCRTVLRDKAEATFHWTIEDFKNRPEKCSEKLESTCFNVNGPGDMKTKWKLVLYPKGYEKAFADYVGVYLYNEGPDKVMASYKMVIIDRIGNERESCKSSTTLLEFAKSGKNGSMWGRHKWLKLDELNDQPDLLPDGNLTIQCTVTVIGPQKILSGSDLSANSNLIVHSQKQIVDHLGKIFYDKNFTDIKIKCHGQSFDCHMAILARSPVFMAMFQSDMKEKENRTVHIDDFKIGVVGEMLKFIYTGDVSSPDAIVEIASELLKAADQYQLDLLKNICEESLCSTLDANNCVEYLVLGDMYRTLKLKMMALRIVVENADSIIDTDVFKDFFKQKPELALEVTKKALNKK